MPRNSNRSNQPQQNTPQRSSQQQLRPSPPPRPQAPSSPSRPPAQPTRPQPQPTHPARPPQQHNPRWPHGLRPNMPAMPRPPNALFMPRGFPIRLSGRIGLIVAPRGRVTMRRMPSRISQNIGTIPNHTFVWIFGENNGWTLINFNGQFGFVNSRFVVI